MMGIVGGRVSARFSRGVIRDAGQVLLDDMGTDVDLPEEMRRALEVDDNRITDLHIWQLGSGHHGATVPFGLPIRKNQPPIAPRLGHMHDLSHLTIDGIPPVMAVFWCLIGFGIRGLYGRPRRHPANSGFGGLGPGASSALGGFCEGPDCRRKPLRRVNDCRWCAAA